MVANTCAKTALASGTGTMTGTYSADHCPTANCMGACTASCPDSDNGYVRFYYKGGTDTKADHQSTCAGTCAKWTNL
jgi:hypothetical protein